MYKYPKSIVPILLFSLPLQRYNLYIEQIHLSLQPILLTLPAAYISLFLRKQLFLKDKKLIFFSFVLILGESLSLIFSINHFRTFSVIAFSSLTLAFTYILYLLVKTKGDLKYLLNILIGVGLMVSLLGIWQFFRFSSGDSVLLPFETFFDSKTITAGSFLFSVNEKSYLRPSSTFVDVNLTAGFLAIVVLLNLSIVVTELIQRKPTGRLILYIGSFALNLTAFSLTVSRSGYLGLCVGGLVFFVLNFRRLLHRRITMLLAVLGVTVIVSIFVFDTPFEAMFGRFKDTFLRHDTTGSTQEHQLFSNAAWQIFKENLIFGIGAGNFEEYYLTRIDTSEDTAYTYNVFLGFLAETGIIGFVAQISFIIYVMAVGFKGLFKVQEDSQRCFLSAAISAYFAILIANLFYSYYILFFAWLPIGLILAFANDSLKLQKHEGSN